MNKYVILSSNGNPDYLNYLPYTIKAWNNLGWDTITFYRGGSIPHITDKIDTKKNLIYRINEDSKYRSETLVQVSRLFAGCIIKEGLIMTGDVDMIPCSNYWNPDPKDITCYGHDLTGRGHYPICYIAMDADKWREVMGCKYSEDVMTAMTRVLDVYPKALSDKWEEWWQVDQDIITEKLKPLNPVTIDRGHDNVFGFLAKGRLDRYNWDATKDIDGIDAHMPRPFNIDAVNHVMNKYHAAHSNKDL